MSQKVWICFFLKGDNIDIEDIDRAQTVAITRSRTSFTAGRGDSVKDDVTH